MKRQAKRVLWMSVLAICAMVVCIVGLALPLLSTELLGMKLSMSAFDYLELLSNAKELGAKVEYPAMMVYVSMGLVALCLVISAISAAVRKRGMLVGTMLLAIGGVVSMLLFASESLEYVDAGFYIFMAGNVFALVVSIIGLVPVKEKAAPKAVPAPVPAPAPAAPKNVCAKCGSEVQPGLKFCTRCGTPVGAAPAPVAPKNACPKCGSEVQPGLKFCTRCGTPVGAASAPAALKNACPKCGTALEPDGKFCKKCGTPVAQAPKAAPPQAVPPQAARPNFARPNVAPHKPEPPKPEPPKEEPAPVDDNHCTKCGAELKIGARFCMRCASMVKTPVVAPASENTEGKRVICPYCGTRQSAENMRCKNCGTVMQ